MEDESEDSPAPSCVILGDIFRGALLCASHFVAVILDAGRTHHLSIQQSLATGRPPSIRLSYVDCEFPEDDEATLDENGKGLVGCQ